MSCSAKNIFSIILSFFLPLFIKSTYGQVESNLMMHLTDIQWCLPFRPGVFSVVLIHFLAARWQLLYSPRVQQCMTLSEYHTRINNSFIFPWWDADILIPACLDELTDCRCLIIKQDEWIPRELVGKGKQVRKGGRWGGKRRKISAEMCDISL